VVGVVVILIYLYVQDVKSGPFMEFQIKENMRLAPIVRLESELLQQAVFDLDQVFNSEVCPFIYSVLYFC